MISKVALSYLHLSSISLHSSCSFQRCEISWASNLWMLSRNRLLDYWGNLRQLLSQKNILRHYIFLISTPNILYSNKFSNFFHCGSNFSWNLHMLLDSLPELHKFFPVHHKPQMRYYLSVWLDKKFIWQIKIYAANTKPFLYKWEHLEMQYQIWWLNQSK